MFRVSILRSQSLFYLVLVNNYTLFCLDYLLKLPRTMFQEFHSLIHGSIGHFSVHVSYQYFFAVLLMICTFINKVIVLVLCLSNPSRGGTFSSHGVSEMGITSLCLEATRTHNKLAHPPARHQEAAPPRRHATSPPLL